jgi:hypothetical protein
LHQIIALPFALQQSGSGTLGAKLLSQVKQGPNGLVDIGQLPLLFLNLRL